MPLQFQNPAFLPLALALLAVAIITHLLARPRSRRWKIACIALPLAAAILLALALARPVLLSSPRARRVVILLDFSPSARTSPWKNPAWLRTLAQSRLPEKTLLTIASFGGPSPPHLLLEDLPLSAPPDLWPLTWNAPETPESSDLTPALLWRTPAEARHQLAPAPRWIITDGLLQSPDLRQPYPIAWTTLPPDQLDLAVAEITIRSTSQSPPAPEILARISATKKTDTQLQISRDDKPLARQSLSFSAPGSRWISIQDPTADQSPHRYQVTILPRNSPDPWPENDHASATYFPQNSPPRILIVGTTDALPALPSSQYLPPANFPTDPSTLLSTGTQIIILNDIPLALDPRDAATNILPQYAAPILDHFVRDTGGGLLILGRAHAFGPGNYAQSATAPNSIEALSPLASIQQNRPALQILFLLDASGSMNDTATTTNGQQKFRLAARGLEQALALLQPQDQISITTFNDNAQTIAHATKADLLATTNGESPLRKALDSVHPTGNTNPDAALPELTRLAQNTPPTPSTPAPEKILILLTDGEIPTLVLPRWKQLLTQSHCSLTIVAPQPSTTSALATLAKQISARWLTTDDAGQWPALLKRAIATQITGAAQHAPLPWQTTTTPTLRGIASQSILAFKKPEAREIATAQSDPKRPPRTLAAIAQRGLGKTAALTIDPGATPDAYNQLLQKLLTDIAPPPGDRRFSLSAHRDEGGGGGSPTWIVTADAIDSGKFLNHQSLKLRLLTRPENNLQPMLQTAPGRYEAKLQNITDLAAIVLRDDTSVRGEENGEQFVGRISAGHVAMNEYPASVDHPPITAPNTTTALSPDLTINEHWTPRITNAHTSLTNPLLLLATLTATSALLLRRGPTAKKQTRQNRARSVSEGSQG